MSDGKCQQCGAELPRHNTEGLCPACLLQAAMPADPGYNQSEALEQDLTPEVIARDFPALEILELIGRGGMGVVYKARQPSLDRFVALKVLLPRFQDDPAFAERFTREARALARLSHPNIVTVYDFGQTAGRYYFVMEYVDGINLREALRDGRFSPDEAISVVPRICEALQVAHDEGIIHRDIKPENILIDQRGRVKIADFGLAKLLRPSAQDFTLTGAREIMGTPQYMAPEQLGTPRNVDHRADIYALGVVFYEMLTGELPVGRFTPPSQKVVIDVRLDDVVLRTLENDPLRRYQSAQDVKTDIDVIAGTPGKATSSASSGNGKTKAPGRKVSVAVLVAAIVSSGIMVVIGSHMYKLLEEKATADMHSMAGATFQRSDGVTPSKPLSETPPDPRALQASSQIADALTQLASRWAQYRPRFTSGTIIMESGTGLVIQRPWETSNPLQEIHFPEYSTVQLAEPRLSADRTKLYARLTAGNPVSACTIIQMSLSGNGSGVMPFIELGPANSKSRYDITADGTGIVYEYRQPNQPTALVLERPRSSVPAWTLTKKSTDGALFPACSSDGKIAYVTSDTLRVMGSRGALAGRNKAVMKDHMIKKYPSFSPDGEWIVYQASAGDGQSYDIYRVRVEGSKPERLTNTELDEVQPCYSSDGTRIVYTASHRNAIQAGETTGAAQLIYTMNADGSNQALVPEIQDGVSCPRW